MLDRGAIGWSLLFQFGNRLNPPRVVIHTTDAGLVGLAFVTAAGLIVYGAIMAIVFRASAWRPVGARSQ